MIKPLLKKIIHTLGYTIQKKAYPVDIQREAEFLTFLDLCAPFTMVSADRSFALYEAVRYLSRNSIQGDFVECGVWKGGQSMLAAYTLLARDDTERKLWLYDTYSGMTEPTEHDVYTFDSKPASQKWHALNRASHNEWCYASLPEVRDNLLQTKYPQEKLVFVKGSVEETIPAQAPQDIALLRLDTDWYESTRHELEHLYPRLVPGGVLLIDDYGSWEGARKAVDEYVQENRACILLSRAGSGRIGVKVA